MVAETPVFATSTDGGDENDDSSSRQRQQRGGQVCCHTLPCKIDYSGSANVDAYFQATDIGPTIQAAQFRGRGLLASSPTVVQGQVMTITNDERVLPVVAIGEITEWHHEHIPDGVMALKVSETRVGRALEWCQIASSLQQPLPIDDDDTT